MNCKYYRTRTEKNIKYGYCLKDKKKVPLFCKECEEYKNTIEEKLKVLNNKPLTQTTNCHQLKQCHQKSKKLAKLEKNRFSILVSSTKCCMCPSKTDLTWHEVFRGRNRSNSMKYGLCLRLCLNCHEKYQEDKYFNDYWHKEGQKRFMEYYHKSIDEFIDVFKKSYL